MEQAFAWCTDIDFCFIDLSQKAAELEEMFPFTTCCPRSEKQISLAGRSFFVRHLQGDSLPVWKDVAVDVMPCQWHGQQSQSLNMSDKIFNMRKNVNMLENTIFCSLERSVLWEARFPLTNIGILHNMLLPLLHHSGISWHMTIQSSP